MNEEKNKEKYIILDKNTPTFSIVDVVENEDADPFGDFLKSYVKKVDVLAKREIMKIKYGYLDKKNKKTVYKPRFTFFIDNKKIEDDKNE